MHIGKNSVMTNRELLAELVSIPSVNPHYAPAGSALCGEKQLADWLAGYLQGLGMRVEWVEQTPGRPNVVASVGNEGAESCLLLEAHMDTVGVGDMTIDPFVPRIERGYLFGRGACDTKGPMAAALAALTPAVLEAVKAAGKRVVFAGTIGEEHGSLGAQELVNAGIGAAYAVVLEPTELSFVRSGKGVLWLRIRATGKSAHGSAPADGANAITALMKLCGFLQERLREEGARLQDPLLGDPTLNVGVFSGGTAVNVVAPQAEVELDMRTLPGQSQDELLAAVDAFLADLKAKGQLMAYEIHVMSRKEALVRPAEVSAFDDLLVSACRAVGRPCTYSGVSWNCDASELSETCGDVVAFGPGSITQAHTPAEYIELDQLDEATRMITALITCFAAQ